MNEEILITTNERLDTPSSKRNKKCPVNFEWKWSHWQTIAKHPVKTTAEICQTLLFDIKFSHSLLLTDVCVPPLAQNPITSLRMLFGNYYILQDWLC